MKRTTTVDRLAELARERKDLSKMVSTEAQRFNAFYAHTQARVLANKKAYIEELQQQQHHRQACNETKQNRSRRREVDYQKQQRSASRRDEAATKDQQSSTSSSTALCESADDEASQQTGSTTPRALFTVAESRKRKRRGGQPLGACGEDDSGVEEDEEEALLGSEGPDDSDPEEEQDEEYQDDDWAASEKQSSPHPRGGREEIRDELINKSAGPSSPVTLGARRRTKRTKFDDNWDKRFVQLVTYFNEYGNALIPQKWKENPTLGKWASNQRYLLAKQRLDPSRYARLDQLGFWDTKFSSTSRAKAN